MAKAKTTKLDEKDMLIWDLYVELKHYLGVIPREQRREETDTIMQAAHVHVRAIDPLGIVTPKE